MAILAIIQNGVVTNRALVDALAPGDVDGTSCDIGDLWDGVQFTKAAPPVVVPQSVSPRQIRQSLNHFGFRTQIENAVAAGDQDLKDWWNYATAFERDHPEVLAMAAAMGFTSAQMDQVWAYAATL